MVMEAADSSKIWLHVYDSAQHHITNTHVFPTVIMWHMEVHKVTIISSECYYAHQLIPYATQQVSVPNVGF